MRHDLQNVDKISKIVHSVADTQKWWVQQIVVVIKCLLCLKFYWLATTCCVATVILTRCVSIPIATFEISNAIWGPREVIVVSWKVFFTFIVIRGGGTGEAGEAAASPDFRGWLTNFLGKKCENRGIFYSCLTWNFTVPPPLQMKFRNIYHSLLSRKK